jgi:hypothetical protein
VLGRLQGPLLPDTRFVLPLTGALVGGWLADPTTNFGILVTALTSDGAEIVSCEGADGKRPRLRVTRAP